MFPQINQFSNVHTVHNISCVATFQKAPFKLKLRYKVVYIVSTHPMLITIEIIFACIA